MEKISILDLKDWQVGQLSGATTAFSSTRPDSRHADLLDDLFQGIDATAKYA